MESYLFKLCAMSINLETVKCLYPHLVAVLKDLRLCTQTPGLFRDTQNPPNHWYPSIKEHTIQKSVPLLEEEYRCKYLAEYKTQSTSGDPNVPLTPTGFLR